MTDICDILSQARSRKPRVQRSQKPIEKYGTGFHDDSEGAQGARDGSGARPSSLMAVRERAQGARLRAMCDSSAASKKAANAAFDFTWWR